MRIHGTLKHTVQIFLSLSVAFSAATAGAGTHDGGQERYPRNPHPTLTPGALCAKPTETRYPESIPYCERDVQTETKRKVIRTYDQVLGFQVGEMERAQFKIDHLIPLCAGGSNEEVNLWPQHKSVYELTDPIEPVLCDLMKRGAMKQEEAIRIIREVKNNLETAKDVLAALKQRLN